MPQAPQESDRSDKYAIAYKQGELKKQCKIKCKVYDLRSYMLNIANHDVDYLDEAWNCTDSNIRRIQW